MMGNDDGPSEQRADASAWVAELHAAMRWPRPPFLVSSPFEHGPLRLYQRLPDSRSLVLVSGALRLGSYAVPVGVLALLSTTILRADSVTTIGMTPGGVSTGVLLVVGVILVWFPSAAFASGIWARRASPDIELATVAVVRRIYQEADEHSPMKVLGLERFEEDYRVLVRMNGEAHRAWSLLWTGYLAILTMALLLALASHVEGVDLFGVSSDPVTPWSVLEQFTWHAVEVVPVVEVADTLNWPEPFEDGSTELRWAVLAVRMIVLVVLASSFRALWRRTMEALDRGGSDGR